MGLYVAIASLQGRPIVDAERDLAIPLHQGAWTAFVHSLLLGFSLLGVHSALVHNGEDFVGLAALSPGRSAEELRRRWVDRMRESLPASRLAAGATLAFGVVVPSVLAVGLARQTGVFARLGLRNALGAILGMTVFSLYFVQIPASELLTTVPAFLTMTPLAVLALVLPFRSVRSLRGPHRRRPRVAPELLDARPLRPLPGDPGGFLAGRRPGRTPGRRGPGLITTIGC